MDQSMTYEWKSISGDVRDRKWQGVKVVLYDEQRSQDCNLPGMSGGRVVEGWLKPPRQVAKVLPAQPMSPRKAFPDSFFRTNHNISIKLPQECRTCLRYEFAPFLGRENVPC